MSNPSPRQLLFKRQIIGLAAALGLIAFVGFLLTTNYRAQRKIQSGTLAALRHETRNLAAATSYFFTEQCDDLRSLAAGRTILTYFENHALGMSLEYGLRVSLAAIDDELTNFVARECVAGDAIYVQIVLSGLDGTTLASSRGAVTPSPDGGAAPTPPAAPAVVADPTHRRLCIVAPVEFKGQVVATLEGRLNLDVLERHLLRDECATGHSAALLGPGPCWYLPEDRQALAAAPPADLLKLPAEQPCRVSADSTAPPLLVVRCSVPHTALMVVHGGPEADIVGHSNPQHLLFALVVLALFVLGVVAVGFRVGLESLVLQDRLAAGVREQETMAAANRRLAAEVTQRRQTEAALHQAKLDAETACRAKTEFLANMSHEIRTPMTAILGFAETLQDTTLTSQEAHDMLQTIQRNGRHLLDVINGILDISKIEAGKLETETVRLPLWPLLLEVQELMRAPASARGLYCRLECRGPLPETIASDPVRLRQILINLVGNALKFTEVGGVRIVVYLLDVARPDRGLAFDIVDTGVGIAAEHLPHIFQPFAQADSSTTRRFGGTGLGLAISQRLAHMLGGEIVVASTPACGSTFRLTVATGPLAGVPLIDAASASSVPAPPPPTPPTPCPTLAGRVLLAEDGPDNQRLIALFLRKAGTTVHIVDNGRAAIEQAWRAVEQHQPFDVILMDMQMPIQDGYSATRALRAQGYRGAIVALTAHAMAHDCQRCLDAGCDAFATKPIERQVLLQTLAQYLSARPRPTSA